MEIENLIHEIRCRLPFEQQLWAMRQMLCQYKMFGFFDDIDYAAYDSWCLANGNEGYDWFGAHKGSTDPIGEIVHVEAAREILSRHHGAIVREYGEDIMHRKGE